VSIEHLCFLVAVVDFSSGMVSGYVGLIQWKMLRLWMKGLIILSIFWTDLVKTIPVDKKNMYQTFLAAEKLKSCSNYNVSVLESDSFKDLCSLPSPIDKDFAKSKDKVLQAMKFNLTPILCYTIFHNVYAVCHPDTKISTKPDLQQAIPSDKFCESISPISLTETCTDWLDDPENTSKDDCVLVNEVVGAVLNNQGFCKNKCIVPDLDEKSPPTINPLCLTLLETSNILVQMSPQGPSDTKQNSSSSSIEVQPPPGLKKATVSPKPKEAEEGKEKKDPESKSGEELVDSASNITEKSVSTKKNPVADEPSKNEAKVAGTTVRIDNDASTNLEVKDDDRSRNVTFKSYSKANIKDSAKTAPDDIDAKNKSSMTTSEIDNESSGSFTSAFEFDYSSDLPPEQQKKEETKVGEDKKEDSKSEKKDTNNGDIEAEPLVSNDEKDKSDVDVEVKDVPVEEKSNEATKSKVEPVLPTAEKEVVETKYENNMKSGPEMDEHSSFFGYFILLSIVAIIAYLVFHNKQKILALVLEGRRRQGNRRRSGGREYRKLDSNLEDTMDPGKETSLRQVIY